MSFAKPNAVAAAKPPTMTVCNPLFKGAAPFSVTDDGPSLLFQREAHKVKVRQLMESIRQAVLSPHGPAARREGVAAYFGTRKSGLFQNQDTLAGPA